ncbi:MAG TPA: hypothetical protein ENH23_03025, partial [candidate division Zixibacteria bacterium]|nr:hypothetical protein [candidate division Zixibacteria bacterium]
MKIDKMPPEGMRTVIFENEPVGYVPETGNMEENIRLAREFLEEKGLWKDVPVERTMYGQAQSFANASNHIYEKDLKTIPRNPQGIAPFVVNAAFSAEMYQKCIQKKYGEVSRTHTLTVLHQNLPNSVKSQIVAHKNQLESEYEVDSGVAFEDHLGTINNAFERWRYIYENSGNSVHIPTIIF